MNKFLKPKDRFPFLLGAIPFLVAGFQAIQMNQWAFATANLVLASANLAAALLGQRFSAIVNAVIMLLDIGMAALVTVKFYLNDTKSLPYFWAAITVGYLMVFVLYQSEKTESTPQEPAA